MEPAQVQILGQWTFDLVATIEPDRSADGTVTEYRPQARYAKAMVSRRHRDGDGPFCRFSLTGLPAAAGVYALAANGSVQYIGRTQNLASRWSLSQYGSIQPKNCFEGGQSTNCRINAAVLQAARAGERLDLYFAATDDHHAVEFTLIRELQPPWNRHGLR